MGNTVLVVDDRPDARHRMGHPLATAGFDVREAATGRDALRLGRLQMDAIVLDLALPDMTGYDVLRKLKDDPATHNIPVIMKTAVYLDDGHREIALAAGAEEYFAEPFDTQALVTTVRRVLDSPSKPRRAAPREPLRGAASGCGTGGPTSARPPWPAMSDKQPFPCIVCGSDDVPLGTASLELPHSSGRKFTFHDVPAFVCTHCGAAAHAAWILADLLDTMNAAVNAGFEGNELEYVPRQRHE